MMVDLPNENRNLARVARMSREATTLFRLTFWQSYFNEVRN